MAKIRQEINILCASLTAAAAGTATSSEIVTLNSNNYNGTITFYLEIVSDTSISLTNTVTLRRSGTSTDDATCTIPLLTTAFSRIRSASFTPPSGSTNYVVFINTSVGGSTTVKSAKIIIIQNAATITNTETQIEIGNNETNITATTATALTNPKYWFYDSTKWDGTLSVTANCTYLTSSTKGTATITVQEDDGNFNLWHNVVTIVSAGAATSATLGTSSSFTPISGRNYRLSVLTSSTKGAISIFNGKIIITYQNWSQSGNSFSISSVSLISALNSTNISKITDDGISGFLATYSFNGTNWFQTGNSFPLNTAISYNLASLSLTEIAMMSGANLMKFQFNGTDWSRNGNVLSITLGGSYDIAALNNTGVAIVDTTNASLVYYQYNNPDWSKNGNSFTITSAVSPSITALNSTGIAYFDIVNDKISRYQFDGINWSKNGNSLTLSSSFSPLCSYNSTGIFFLDNNAKSISSFLFDGLNWNYDNKSYIVGNIVSDDITLLNSTGIAVVNNSTLTRYQLDNTSISKLEPQYLFNNTSTTTTGPNSFLNYYDPTDWSNVNNTYIMSHDGTTIATASKLQTGGIDIINTSITGRNFQLGDVSENFVARPNFYVINGTGLNSGLCQGFTALSGWNVIGCKFYLSGSGTVSGGYYCNFVSGNNPSGAVIRTSSINTGSGMPVGTLSGFTFYLDSGIRMASGTSGIFQLLRTLSGGAVIAGGSSAGNPYTSGFFFKNQTGFWMEQSQDLSMEVLLDITMPLSSGDLDLNLVTS